MILKYAKRTITCCVLTLSKKFQTLQDALAMRRNFFVDLVAHEANAWRKHLPSIVKHYLRRITGKNIE
jgi:lysyl-tRNA synthetase class II